MSLESRSFKALFDQGQSGKTYISIFAVGSFEQDKDWCLRLVITSTTMSNDLRKL